MHIHYCIQCFSTCFVSVVYIIKLRHSRFSEFSLEWKSPRLSFKGKWFSSFSSLSLYRRVRRSLRLNAQGRTKKERKGDYFLSYKRFRLCNSKYCHLFTFFLIILVLVEYLVKICCTFVLLRPVDLKLLFGFPFVLNPIIVVKKSSRKANYQCSYIYYGLKSISVMLLVTRHVGASLINLEETLSDFTRKAILNFGGSNILFSSLLWICFFMYVRVVL